MVDSVLQVAGNVGGAVSPVLQVAKWLAAPIWRHFKYLLNYNTNFVNLQEQVDKLKNARDEVQRKVIAAENKVEEIKENVKIWQEGVEKMIIEAEHLIEEKANNPRCFKGLCPNFIIHYKQSKKAFKLKQNDIDTLLQQEKELDPVSNPSNPREIWLRTSEDNLTFESRNSTMKNVWDALNDENAFMIGVYGMGGLGKTTLVQEIGRKAEKENLFEEIVFVEVSESPDIKKIQTTIADKLKLEYKNESEMASKIYSAMEKRKILLILDNIWKDVVLDKEVGIPRGANHGRSKLLFTTRNVDVLRRMDCTNNFGMDFLNEDEAWTLFTKMAGNVIQTCGLNSLANDICKECGGLPIVICTVATSLRYQKEKNEWENALRVLRTSPKSEFTELLGNEYTKIRLSYDCLGDELKQTFIICSLMGNDTSILDLLKNMVGLGIVEGDNLTIAELLNKLEVTVNKLKCRCLLLDGRSRGRFSMHDVIRLVAVTCAYQDNHVYTGKNDIKRVWKIKDKLKLCQKISLVSNDLITQLWHEELDCPKLEFFQASQMDSSIQIPKGFFNMMPQLKVLNLFELQQSLLSLSLSIDHLANLQTLCLDGSKIKDVAIIEKFEKLKVLSLRKTLIKEFHLSRLTQLEVLDLSRCWNLTVIAPEVISQLKQLEAFYARFCHINWEHRVLEEVKLLPKLTILELDIEENNVLPANFFSKELKRYKISIGRLWFRVRKSKLRCLRRLIFKFNSTSCLEQLYGIKNVEVLQLYESSNEENDTEVSKVILQSSETRPLFNKKVILTDLMTLELIKISFEMIWESQLPTSSCKNLTQLLLDGCNNIKYLFPFSVAKSLEQLQYLRIEDCKVLEKIIKGVEVVDSIFLQLTELKFRDLPKLGVFYQSVHALDLPMLKSLEVQNCPNFTGRYQYFQENNEGEVEVVASKSICLEHKINSDLEVMTLEDDWKGEKRRFDWSGEDKTLDISHANISIGLLQRFHNLKVLRVTNSSLEPQLMSKVILTGLMTLNLSYISSEMIWESQLSTFSYENLSKLTLDQCNNIKYVFPFFVAKSLTQLRFLKIGDCKVLEKIIKEEEGAEVVDSIFPQLTKLKFRDLPKLRVFYQGVHALELPILKRLEVQNCPNFTRRYQYFQENNEGEVEVLESKSICLEHKINSDLEVIELWDNSEEEDRQFDWSVEDKTLDICHANISVGLLQGFCNLKVLRVSDSSLEPKLMSKVILTGLMTLNLSYISSEMIWESQLSTSSCENLTKLTLDQCNNIKYVFPFFVAKSLTQLRFLKIGDCKVLEKIIKEEEGVEVVYSIFPQLTKLKFRDLPKLRVFYQSVHALELPMLKTLEVQNCANFTKRYQYFQENNEEGEVDVLESKSICLEHKINSDLEVITLKDVWEGERRRFDWSGEDKTLDISDANISIGLLQRFHNLKVLCVTNSSLEPQLMSKVVLTDLMTLELVKISFEMIWESQLSTSFYENLTKLILYQCNKIKYVFPFFVAKSFKQLQYLGVEECEVLEKIIEVEEEEGIEVVNSIFPHITELVLRYLPKLTVFYQGAHALDLLVLKVLKIEGCPNFTSSYEGFQDNNENGEVQVSESKSICLEHKINSDLEVIILWDVWKEKIGEIDWSGEDKTLKLSRLNISIGLLQRFYNLKVLRVTNSSLPKLMSKVKPSYIFYD